MESMKNFSGKKSRKIQKLLKTTEYSWQAIYAVTCICICMYLFFEWVFVVTKPTFFGSDPFLIKLNTLLFSTSLALLAATVIILCLCLPGTIFRHRVQRITKSIALAFSALVISSLVLLLIDNFTYVVFDFGIVSTRALRILYMVGFLFLSAYFYIALIRKAHDLTIVFSNLKSNKWWIPAFFALTLLVCLLTARYNETEIPDAEYSSSNGRNELPSIILITADGLDAQHMSAYGYARDTTPYIQELANTSLVAENAFTNAGNTAGSLISIYTGKYPTNTRVLFAPDILKNQNTTEHVISLIKNVGYSSTQFSYPYYADAFDLNLRSGFDVANGRSMESTQIINLLGKYLDSNQSYFIYQIITRLIDRLSHIFYVKDMVNLSLLAEGKAQSFNDQYKFDSAVKILEQSENPVFIHIHCMETHGPLFNPYTVRYSAHKEVSKQLEYDIDFYDDSILDFDDSVGRFIDVLKLNGTYDNTIIIIGSDHGQRYTTNKRIPLILHFPNNAYSGKILSNVQNIDIAPTILDYLKIEQPIWMAGDSLLTLNNEQRPIFSFTIGQYNQEGDDIFAFNNKPPFYQFGNINVNYCGKFFRLTFEGKKWESGNIEGYTSQCDSITDEQAYQLMVEHLIKYNFDVSSLKGYSIVEK
jgi:membrane-anchored protein YejM (alkaline phosphatase superfamily)